MTEPARGHRPDRGGLAEDQAPRWRVADRIAASLEDPEAYDAFARMLYAKIQDRLATPLDPKAQAELAELTRLLISMPRRAVDEHRVAFETAFDLLAAATPNLLVIRCLRLNLETAEQRQSSQLARLILRLCGETPLTAVLAALASVFVLSLAAIALMAQGHQWLEEVYDVVELQVGQIMLLVHAAFIGSIVSILVRVRDYLAPDVLGPLGLYVSVLTKPFVAVAFALLVYTVLKAGLVSFLGVDLGGPQGPYLAWLLGFLSGCSERFAKDFITGASAKLGETPLPDPQPSAGGSQDRP